MLRVLDLTLVGGGGEVLNFRPNLALQSFALDDIGGISTRVLLFDVWFNIFSRLSVVVVPEYLNKNSISYADRIA